MKTLLVVLSVIEILLFVVVLGAYLVRIATRLRHMIASQGELFGDAASPGGAGGAASH